MTTSQTPFLSEIASGEAIPAGTLAYFQARTRNNLYNFILTKFLEKERESGLTRAQLARRIGRSPEVITRLLGAPGNWTIGTISDLLLGIAGEELSPASCSVLDRAARNFTTSDWLDIPPRPSGHPITRDTGAEPVGELEFS